MRLINRIGYFIGIFIFIAIFYLYYATQHAEKNLEQNLESLFLQQAAEAAQNIETMIKKYVPQDPVNTLAREEFIREGLQNSLSLLVNSSFKYIYVLYRDQKGRYRYLLDGSKTDRGEFGQKLDVEKSLWDSVYRTKEDKIISHTNLSGLWITYLKPLIYDDEVKAVIAIDFSTTLPKHIRETTEPIESIFNYIFGAIVILIILLMYQLVLNYFTKKSSYVDALTEVYNRTYLREFLRYIDPSKYHILMIDVDHFKKINDNFGHKAGDHILKEVALILKKLLRSEDKIIRFGGEEFLVFVEKDQKQNDSLPINIAHRIKSYIEKYDFSYHGYRINLTVSIGICTKPERFKDINHAIKTADAMLYQAKKEGRNKIIIFSQQEKNQSCQIEYFSIYQVQEALDQNRVICHYQPIYDLESMRIVKYEALVRIVEKDGSLVYPGAFLGQIENTNVYHALTKRVLHLVFEKIARYRVPISVNLKFSDLSDNVIFRYIIEEIESHRDIAKWLIIELLENENIDDKNIVNVINRLKDYKVKIAIDDFGSGFSNFVVFKTLPIDILKLDGSLIKELDNSDISFNIANAIVHFAQSLNIEVVAEFIHSKEVLDKVKQLNIRYGQGFYLGRPAEKIESPSNAEVLLEST